MSSISSDLQFLNIDPRAYKYIRENAVKNIYDALTEIITNCVDAYRNPILNYLSVKVINVHCDLQNRELKVTDNAIGLTGEFMQAYFLTVGAYTSNEVSRGYFSRGAKDLCAIGDVTFSTIKDGKFSSCSINQMGMGQTLSFNIDATQEHRDTYGIPENGLNVKIKLKSTVTVNEENLITNLENYYTLRDILTEDIYKINMHLIKTDGSTIDKLLKFEHPQDSEKIIDLEYSLERYGYPNATAKFTLYKTKNLIEEYENGDLKFNKYGIIVSSGLGIHDNTSLHYTLRNNPNFERLYGKIECNYINTLLHQIDEVEKSYDEALNPYSIINPSRQDGLEKQHPFTKALYDIPYKRTLYVLSEMTDLEDPSNIQASNINELLSNVEVVGEDVVDSLDNGFTNFVVVDRLVNHIKNDMEKYDIIEDNALPYSKESIESRMNLNTENGKKAKPKFRIKFSEKDMTYKYQVFKDISGLVLQISLNHIGLKQYMECVEGEMCGLNDVKTRIILSDIITEALSMIIMENELDKASPEVVNTKLIRRKFELAVNAIEKQVYNIMVLQTSRFAK